MYKVVDHIEIINRVNQAAKLYENNQNVNYCEIQKHPTRDEYALPVIESILSNYDLADINELKTGLIGELPEDWYWPYPERAIRLSIPLGLQARSLVSAAMNDGTTGAMLGHLLNAMLPLVSQYIITTNDKVIVYLEELFEEHNVLLSEFEEVSVEIR